MGPPPLELLRRRPVLTGIAGLGGSILTAALVAGCEQSSASPLSTVGPNLQTTVDAAVRATVSASKPAPTPLPPRPTAAIEQEKNGETASAKVTLVKITEIKGPVSVGQGLLPPPISSLSEGSKLIVLDFALDNPDSRSPATTTIAMTAYEEFHLITQDGASHTPDFMSMPFFKANRVPNILPPGFRARGIVTNDIRSLDGKKVPKEVFYNPYYTHPDDAALKKAQFMFYLKNQAVPVRLKTPAGEIDLQKKPTGTDQLKFPTDKPDSNFNELGSAISIPGKGPISIEIAERKPLYRLYTREGESSRPPDEKIGNTIVFKAFFRNDSKDAQRKVDLVVRFFGEDGILYTAYNQESERIFPTKPSIGDGYLTRVFASPSQRQSANVELVISSSVRRGKLVVSGEIDAIFNVDLPFPA